MAPEQQGSGSPFSLGLNYSDTGPSTFNEQPPVDNSTESSLGETTAAGIVSEAGQNETKGDAEVGQFPPA